MADVIVVDRVSKAFGETRALVDCTFRAQGGEIHAIVGENGSGKSTLAKIMSGVIWPDKGEIRVVGRSPRSPVEARRLGIATIFQEVLVADELTVLENLFVGSDVYGITLKGDSARRHAAATILRRLTLIDVDLDASVGPLPLALKQWIVIARALLTNPKILILDESSAALDLDATNRLHDEMRRLRVQGTCVVLVTHRIAELIKISDRATVLRDGSVAGVLEKSEINERSLLTAMTAATRMQRLAEVDKTIARRPIGETIIRARDIETRAGATPFNFELRKGEIVGVAGLDGQGQQIFVRAVAGIDRDLRGEFEAATAFGQKVVKSLSDAEVAGISYVSGDRKREGIFPNLSIFENFGLALFKKSGGLMGWLNRQRVREAYEKEVKRFSIKIGSSANRITSLSGGNQQKVLIGRAFAQSPSLIVLDDPARGVDLGTKVELYDELRQYSASGGAVLYLSSEIEEFLGFADRVIVFHRGTLFRDLSGEDLTEQKMLAAMFGHDAPVTFDDTDMGRLQ
jgi:ribose transport system ATP-binding protein